MICIRLSPVMSNLCQIAGARGAAGQLRRKVLIIEDHPALVANLFAFLEPRGYYLDAAPDGSSGLSLAMTEYYDAVLIDWMLPRMEGTEVVRRLRESGCNLPLLMLTARSELPDKIAGFRAGVDDYLTKPFAMAELEVRLEALILRSQGRARLRLLKVADLRFDLSTQQVTRGARVLQLHAACRKLLELLMRESPAVVTRERLESVLWGEERPDRDVLRSHIYELRKRVDSGDARKLIHTLPRLGYCLALRDDA